MNDRDHSSSSDPEEKNSRSRLATQSRAEDCPVEFGAALPGQSQSPGPEPRANRNRHLPGRSGRVAAFESLGALHPALRRSPLPSGSFGPHPKVVCVASWSEPPKIARLGVVILIAGIVAIGDHITQAQSRFLVFRGFLGGRVITVGVVVGAAAAVARGHGSIALVVHHRAARLVHQQLLVVGADPVALGIGIGHQPRLQYLVGAGSDPRREHRRTESRLLYFREIVGWVAVQFQNADLHQGIVAVGPHFRQIKRVPLEGFRLFLSHDLDFDRPLGKLAPIDRGEQIPLVRLTIDPNQIGRFLARDALHALLSCEICTRSVRHPHSRRIGCGCHSRSYDGSWRASHDR